MNLPKAIQELYDGIEEYIAAMLAATGRKPSTIYLRRSQISMVEEHLRKAHGAKTGAPRFDNYKGIPVVATHD